MTQREDKDVKPVSGQNCCLGEAMELLSKARVADGIGGVGVGTVALVVVEWTIDLIDDDKVCLTNINRQIIETRKTIGNIKWM